MIFGVYVFFGFLLFITSFWLLTTGFWLNIKVDVSNVIRHVPLLRARGVSLFIITLTLSSCLKEDKILPPHQAGDINTVQIVIEFPYKNQVFYNCEQNKVISTNSRYDWDLGFESSGNHIKLNIARPMFVANMGNVNFNTVNNINNAVWLWDNQNGNLDSLALNSWNKLQGGQILYSNNIYIINRSFDNDGNDLGIYKIVFQEVDNNSFTFKYAKLDGSEENTYTLIKDVTTNFTSFSFDNGGQTINIEPNNDTWDLEFTNLQHYFSNLPLPFILTQCVSNIYNGTTVAEGNGNNFSAISLKDTANYIFTNIQDEIGYDWKIRNSQNNSFEIDPNKFFIVRTKVGLFYKIRFIDFYNSSGEKGYPKFEIQKL